MLRNRDTQRVNRGNKAIQASLLSKLNNEIIKKLSVIPVPSSHDNEKIQLLNLANRTNDMLLQRFNRSQTSINKATCEKYASVQHGLICRAIRYNEDITQVTGLSSYIIDDEIIAAYDELSNFSS